MSSNQQTDSSRMTAASALATMQRTDSSPSPSDDAERDSAKSNAGSTSLPAHAASSISTTDESKVRSLDLEVPLTFPQRLMEILSGPACEDIISWLPHGRGFIIYQKRKFASEILPRYFKQSKFTSFTRKLNRWGFTRITRGPEAGAYYHEFFQRDNHRLCMQMACVSGIKGAKVETSVPTGLEGLTALNSCDLSPEAKLAAVTTQAQNILSMQALMKAQTEALRQALLGVSQQPKQVQLSPQLAAAAMNAMCPGSSLSMGHSPAAIAAAINNANVSHASYLSNLRDKQATLALASQTPNASAAPLQTRNMLERLASERRVLAAAHSSRTSQQSDTSAQQRRRPEPGKSFRASAA